MKFTNTVRQWFSNESARKTEGLCACSDIGFKFYPRKNEGKLIQLLSGEWVAKSSLPYMAPERFLCRHELERIGQYN
jgi:hypothetical protein